MFKVVIIYKYKGEERVLILQENTADDVNNLIRCAEYLFKDCLIKIRWYDRRKLGPLYEVKAINGNKVYVRDKKTAKKLVKLCKECDQDASYKMV